jgi:hypothetical protein
MGERSTPVGGREVLRGRVDAWDAIQALVIPSGAFATSRLPDPAGASQRGGSKRGWVGHQRRAQVTSTTRAALQHGQQAAPAARPGWRGTSTAVGVSQRPPRPPAGDGPHSPLRRQRADGPRRWSAQARVSPSGMIEAVERSGQPPRTHRGPDEDSRSRSLDGCTARAATIASGKDAQEAVHERSDSSGRARPTEILRPHWLADELARRRITPGRYCADRSLETRQSGVSQRPHTRRR